MTFSLSLSAWDALDIVCILLIAGAAMLFVMGLMAGHTARVERRSAFEHLGRHLTRLGVGMGFLGYAGSLAVFFILASALQLEEGVSLWNDAFWLEAGGGVLMLLLLVMVQKRELWRTVAAIGAVGLWGLFPVWKAAMLGGYFPDAVSPDLPELAGLIAAGALNDPVTLLLNIGLFALGGLTVSGGLALVYLVMRRGKDEYGRDYYRMAAVVCARRAAWGAGLLAVSLGVQIGMAVAEGDVDSSEWAYIVLGVLEGSLVLALACWLAVARSENPMRFKSLMVAGAVLLAVFSVSLAEAFNLSPRFLGLL